MEEKLLSIRPIDDAPDILEFWEVAVAGIESADRAVGRATTVCDGDGIAAGAEAKCTGSGRSVLGASVEESPSSSSTSAEGRWLPNPNLRSYVRGLVSF